MNVIKRNPEVVDKAVENITRGVTLGGVPHPVDKVEVYRRIEKWAGDSAKKQEAANDRDGVPE